MPVSDIEHKAVALQSQHPELRLGRTSLQERLRDLADGLRQWSGGMGCDLVDDAAARIDLLEGLLCKALEYGLEDYHHIENDVAREIRAALEGRP